MPPVARLGDLTWGKGTHHHTDCPHFGTGMIITSAKTVLAEGSPVARFGDLNAHFWCPHCRIGILDGPVANVFSEGILETGLGKSVNEICGKGVIISSARTVWSTV